MYGSVSGGGVAVESPGGNFTRIAADGYAALAPTVTSKSLPSHNGYNTYDIQSRVMNLSVHQEQVLPVAALVRTPSRRSWVSLA